MTFQDIVVVQHGLAELQSNAEVRRLLSLVVQDAQNETVDLRASATSVVEKPMRMPTKLALIAIRNYLQDVFNWMSVARGTPMAKAFLYENHTRLQKLLVVAKLLDHANLQSFGTPEKPVLPMTSDIPTYARLWSIILDFRRQDLEALHAENQAALSQLPDDFKYLCPEDDRETFRQRCPN